MLMRPTDRFNQNICKLREENLHAKYAPWKTACQLGDSFTQMPSNIQVRGENNNRPLWLSKLAEVASALGAELVQEMVCDVNLA